MHTRGGNGAASITKYVTDDEYQTAISEVNRSVKKKKKSSARIVHNYMMRMCSIKAKKIPPTNLFSVQGKKTYHDLCPHTGKRKSSSLFFVVVV